MRRWPGRAVQTHVGRFVRALGPESRRHGVSALNVGRVWFRGVSSRSAFIRVFRNNFAHPAPASIILARVWPDGAGKARDRKSSSSSANLSCDGA
eukprot:4308911-Lingulodinium_polyedra.AAC.1